MINVELHCILWVPSSTATLNNSVRVRVFESMIMAMYSEKVTKFKNILPIYLIFPVKKMGNFYGLLRIYEF